MQKITIIGFVGRDPEERVTAGGRKLKTFPVAVNIKKSGETVTQWYKINCWESISSAVISYVKKGSLIVVMGDLNPISTYQNKKGDIVVDMSITCNSISFLPSTKYIDKANEQTSTAPAAAKKEESSTFDWGKE